MAVAKAQYAISEITAMLRKKGINVRVSQRSDNDVWHDLNVIYSLLFTLSLAVCQGSAMFC